MSIRTIALRPAPLVTGGLRAFLFLAFFAFVLEFVPLVVQSLVGFCAVAAVWLVVLLVRRPREPQCIELRDDVVRLPRRWGSAEIVELPYADLRSTGYAGKGAARWLVIRSARAELVFPFSAFADGPDILPLLREELYERLERVADGVRLKARVLEQDLVDERVWERKPYATYILCAALAAIFVAELISRGEQDEFDFIRDGGLVPFLVADGQWWRLLSSAFLHVNALHVWVNASSLFFLGALLERTIGVPRFVVIYTASAIAGSVASMLFANADVSVGASGAIFGLLGALAVIQWCWRGRVPAGVAQSQRWWIVIIGLNGALPVMVPQINFAAHLGGLFCGILATWLLVRRSEATDLPLSGGARLRAATIGCIALAVVACGVAVWHSGSRGVSDQLVAARWMMEDASSSPAAKNNAAWAIATNDLPVPRGEEREWLERALRAALAAVADEQDNASCRDTLSHVLHRLGRLDEAIAAEKKALELSAGNDQTTGYRLFYYDLEKEKFEARVRELKAQQGGQGR